MSPSRVRTRTYMNILASVSSRPRSGPGASVERLLAATAPAMRACRCTRAGRTHFPNASLLHTSAHGLRARLAWGVGARVAVRVVRLCARVGLPCEERSRRRGARLGL
eukprot:2236293-Pleurochrysis_carterae.AAC.1